MEDEEAQHPERTNKRTVWGGRSQLNLAAKVKWLGHVCRMKDERDPKKASEDHEDAPEFPGQYPEDWRDKRKTPTGDEVP